jgi:hypothetical protein
VDAEKVSVTNLNSISQSIANKAWKLSSSVENLIDKIDSMIAKLLFNLLLAIQSRPLSVFLAPQELLPRFQWQFSRMLINNFAQLEIVSSRN